jgi:uncharacterized protein YndB with AHSA1/START domain
MRTVFAVRYEHPVEIVWSYLAEPEKWLEYVPALVERTRIDSGPIGPGSRRRSVDRVGPLRVEFTDELVAIEPFHRVIFKQSSPWNSKTEYRVEADGNGTVVHVHFEGTPTGKIRWLDLMPDWLATRVYRNDMQNLTRVLGTEMS